MIPDPLTMIVPLRMDERGAILVSGTRVTLDTVIVRHHQGIVQKRSMSGFPLCRSRIFTPSSHLAHCDELDAY